MNRKTGLVVLMLFVWLITPATGWAATQIVYDDALSAGWSNWSWATVNLSNSTPVHNGSHSIAVTYSGGWQGLYLHHAGLYTAGFTHLRFYLHGGSSGGQAINLYATCATAGGDENGPSVSVTPPVANTWSLVSIPLADLGADNATLTGLVWQDSTGGAQPTFYVDDIMLARDDDPDGPILSQAELPHAAVPADGYSGVIVRVQVNDPQGLVDIAQVTLDATSLGRGTVTLFDDGRHNDGSAGDGQFGAIFTIPAGTPVGEHALLVTAQDQAGHSSAISLGRFVVLNTPGGAIPTDLFDRPAFGSNGWSENPLEDWQPNTGLPWDFVYQYITYDWYVNGWGGNFVGRFVSHAWTNGYVPVISVYIMLGVEPGCTSEGAACYAQKLQNATTVSHYLAALQEAARQAQGNQPVIFQLEPDFYGYMQQNNYATGKAQPDSPANYPVALNISGYANNLAGFGQRLVDIIHTTAPNVLVAPHASMWATNGDPSAVTAAEAVAMAQSTAAFIDAMGGNRADLLFVEWSDRDSGCAGLAECTPPRPWWDDTNRNLPNPNRAVLWENALSRASGKRLILWQVPVGNMALNNTCNHYQDNRVAYIFTHPRDLYEAGVLAVLFGGGAGCSTQPDTDGGFLQAQAQTAYALPPAPAGLTANSAGGPIIALRWDEIDRADQWRYRVQYTRSGGGGSSFEVTVNGANSTNLLTPQTGQWQIKVAAIDALGQVGPYGSAITATTLADAEQVYLPLILR